MTLFNSRLARALCMMVLAATLTACGFHLRGSEGYNLPFHTIYLGFPDNSPLGAELRRNLRGLDGLTVVTTAKGAEAQVDVVSETRGKTILSLNSQGRVREYLLTYTFVFKVRNGAGVELLGPTEIALKRNIAFNEDAVLAKESEEALLIRDMQTDLVQQVLRRLAAIKPI
ncbi:LPS-assembly lipoprotein LptE [Massilia sp. S19_KUP03_FR1]|uniref:LPS-assembly lipoprotein LptE n=1 Tax=Massilia sp. S19_KUP03_FR1 TaxID=3025503 RepID=UPI002FCD94FF